MSLINEMMEDFCFVNKIKTSDNAGGYITEWLDGADIQAIATMDSSMISRQAQQDGLTSIYTITTSQSIILEKGDVIKRKRDGYIFRVTSDGNDKTSPKFASEVFTKKGISQVTAERFKLTS